MGQKLLFLGDLFYDYPFVAEDIERLSNWIHENGFVTIVNLEGCTLQDEGTSISKRGPNLSNDLAVFSVMEKLNVRLACLANNHMMDFGEAGLRDTISLLEKHGIAYVGAGLTLLDALMPAVLNVGGQRIAFLNFGWDIEETVYASDTSAGCAPRDETVILQQIRMAKEKYEKVCVCMHWGFEYNRYPMPIDITLAHKMVDSGAELVIGHHPHCVQPKQTYKGKRIYYSLGNFYFSSERASFGKVFKEAVSNQSDYGLMVDWDCETSGFSEYVIRYDHNTNASKRLEHFTDTILTDISDEIYYSNSYIKKVKLHKSNVNPVLCGDMYADRFKLKLLFSYYKVKAVAKLILKRRRSV